MYTVQVTVHSVTVAEQTTILMIDFKFQNFTADDDTSAPGWPARRPMTKRDGVSRPRFEIRGEVCKL